MPPGGPSTYIYNADAASPVEHLFHSGLEGLLCSQVYGLKKAESSEQKLKPLAWHSSNVTRSCAEWLGEVSILTFMTEWILFQFMLLHAPSCSFMLLHAPSCSFMLLHAPSCSFMLLHAPSCSFMLLHAPSCSFMLLQSFNTSSFIPAMKPEGRTVKRFDAEAVWKGGMLQGWLKPV